jgi:ribose 5-phosphate isomerase A
MTNVEEALKLVNDGTTIGLGSGHAADRFIVALGERVRAGLRVRGVPTSNASARLAASVGIPLVSLEEGMPLDVTVDGADEVDPFLNLIKGYGHALVREKIVAAASRRLVILIGPEHVREKLVDVLGKRGKLPVEVVPFALPLVRLRLAEFGCPGELVQDGGKPLVTDNGNHILECTVASIHNPTEKERQLRSIPGVVETGLFLELADVVLIEDGGRVEARRRSGR